MAKMNKLENFDLNDHKIINQVQSSSLGNVKESILDVVKTKILAFRFFNMCFCWLTVTMVYYGLSLNATNLAGNPYTNFLLVALVEIPGKFTVLLGKSQPRGSHSRELGTSGAKFFFIKSYPK